MVVQEEKEVESGNLLKYLVIASYLTLQMPPVNQPVRNRDSRLRKTRRLVSIKSTDALACSALLYDFPNTHLSSPLAMAPHSLVGKPAPAISLPNQHGETYTFTPGASGAPVCLFFYPKAGE